MAARSVPPAPRTAAIACGALAREVLALKRLNGWSHLDLHCLPALLHNTPARIPEAVRAKIHELRADYDHIVVVYGDCGTSGELDAILAEEGVERIAGPHCYAFFAGQSGFESLQEEEPGTFYLTDFLARHFETMVVRSLGLDRHPDLAGLYFGNYSRLVYLAQSDDPSLLAAAREAALRLGLEFVHKSTGYGELAPFLDTAVSGAIRRVA